MAVVRDMAQRQSLRRILPRPQNVPTSLELLMQRMMASVPLSRAQLYSEGRRAVTLRFDASAPADALVRRDSEAMSLTVPSSASARGLHPWQWRDLAAEFNSFGRSQSYPNTGDIGWPQRMHDGGVHTALCYLDVRTHYDQTAQAAHGGDTSYPCLVWHNDVLYSELLLQPRGQNQHLLTKLKIHPKPVVDTNGE